MSTYQRLQFWRRPESGDATCCKACAGIFATERNITDLCSVRGYKHLSITNCWKSAEAGCMLCKIIFQRGWQKWNAELAQEAQSAQSSQSLLSRLQGNTEPLLHFFADNPPPEVRQGKSSSKREPLPRSQLKGTGKIVGALHKDIVKVQYWSPVIEFVVLAKAGDPMAEIFPRRPFLEDFMDDEIMSEALDWIHDCTSTNKHDGCVYEGKPKLPTRVIDVRNADSGIVKIRPTQGEEYENYVALSYTWGGPQPLTATNGNITQLMNAIDMSDLPLVYRMLYSWLGDLDKANEIGKMGELYRNATVTIVAATSPGAKYPFLHPNLSRAQTPSHVLSGIVPGSRMQGEVTLAVEVRANRPIHPLLTRGWALQEAMLSSRLVTFSEFEVYCECNKKGSSKRLNSGPLRLYDSATLYAPDRRLFSEFQYHKSVHGEKWMNAEYLGGVWEEMVVEFTRRNLTVADDRLAGVEGLASEMSLHLEPDLSAKYVAGTWIACLPQLLLWSRSDDAKGLSWDKRDADGNELPTQTMTQKTRSPRAPNWSWACLDCPIRFFSDSGDKYGAKASLVDTTALSQQTLDRLSSMDIVKENVLRIGCRITRRTKQEYTTDKSTGPYRIVDDLEIDELGDGEGVYYAFLSRNIAETGNPDIPGLRLWYASGIVLREVSEGLFRRVAYLRRYPEEEVGEDFVFGEPCTITLV
ncbi:hypothetical protein PT974_12184 [Cladobotryum mycophilum]|uniref:Heterokaryon incompatibility domain-containing protein n=1 Tax=Cladobotryum mycophilum TaxID=491253 RepID=A0ABR0S7E5_9HYPO